MNHGKPQLKASANAGQWLMQTVTKAALVDLYLRSLASRNVSDSVSLAELVEDADPVLEERREMSISARARLDQDLGRDIPE